jgi:hypothetical protein
VFLLLDIFFLSKIFKYFFFALKRFRKFTLFLFLPLFFSSQSDCKRIKRNWKEEQKEEEGEEDWNTK